MPLSSLFPFSTYMNVFSISFKSNGFYLNKHHNVKQKERKPEGGIVILKEEAMFLQMLKAFLLRPKWTCSFVLSFLFLMLPSVSSFTPPSFFLFISFTLNQTSSKRKIKNNRKKRQIAKKRKENIYACIENDFYWWRIQEKKNNFCFCFWFLPRRIKKVYIKRDPKAKFNIFFFLFYF